MRSHTLRVPDNEGEKIVVLKQTDPVTGDVVIAEVFNLTGHPAQFLRLTSLAGISQSIEFPPTQTVGTGSTPTTIKLAGGTPSFDVVGLLAVVTQASNAAGLGQFCLVKNVAGDTLTVSGFSGFTPSSGDKVELIIDCRNRSTVLTRTEFEGSDGTCTLVPILFDYARAPSAGSGITDGEMGFDTTKRAPIRYAGNDISSYAFAGITNFNLQTNYYLGRTAPEDTRGAVGVKFFLKELPPNGKRVQVCASAI